MQNETSRYECMKISKKLSKEMGKEKLWRPILSLAIFKCVTIELIESKVHLPNRLTN